MPRHRSYDHFMTFWRALNATLRALGQPEAAFKQATETYARYLAQQGDPA